MAEALSKDIFATQDLAESPPDIVKGTEWLAAHGAWRVGTQWSRSAQLPCGLAYPAAAGASSEQR